MHTTTGPSMPVRPRPPSSCAAPSCLVLLVVVVVLRVLIGVMASRAETCASVRHFDDRKARADSETVDESRERQGRGGGGQMGGGAVTGGERGF